MIAKVCLKSVPSESKVVFTILAWCSHFCLVHYIFGYAVSLKWAVCRPSTVACPIMFLACGRLPHSLVASIYNCSLHVAHTTVTYFDWVHIEGLVPLMAWTKFYLKYFEELSAYVRDSFFIKLWSVLTSDVSLPFAFPLRCLLYCSVCWYPLVLRASWWALVCLLNSSAIGESSDSHLLTLFGIFSVKVDLW